ncbi:MAG: translation initiation factor IF-2 [Lachnospiraceae bacterium]|nr:translation initiation factor IF-2 [Lachnospiraceae bacterium]
MAKIRIHELAKELGIESKSIIAALDKKGIPDKKAASSLDAEQESYIRQTFSGGKAAAKPDKAEQPAVKKTEDNKSEDKKIETKKTGTVKKPVKKDSASKTSAEGKTGADAKQVSDQKAAESKKTVTTKAADNKSVQDKKTVDNKAQAGPAQDKKQAEKSGQITGKQKEQQAGGSKPQNQPSGGNKPQNQNQQSGGNKPQNQNQQSGGNKPSQEHDKKKKNGNQKPEKKEHTIVTFQAEGTSKKNKKKNKHDNNGQNGNGQNGNAQNPNAKQEKKSGAFIKPEVKPVEKEPEDTIKTMQFPPVMSIKEFADKIGIQVNQLIKKMFLAGKMVNVNSDIEFDEAADIALEYNIIAEEEEQVDLIEEMLKEEEEDESLMTPRPPVVCVMGHVDHGKTSLLDAIRTTNVTDAEAGGITQHIGASVVRVGDQTITFLDTPGHEAFTAMRMRGAQSTDIAILVVAADDGVMPQTIEAINHAKAAGVEIIVAVNKIDKESANVERVKQELMEYELVAEEWGGSTIFCPVSAHTKEGIDNLLDMILLTAEVMELKANKNRKARGIVIEAELDKGRGSVATVLVQKGTLHIGDIISVGNVHGKVRAMEDDKHRRVKEAGPSKPVEIIGLNGVPNAGDIFMAVDTEKEARTMSEAFIRYEKDKLIAETKSKMSLDDLFSQIQAGNVKELNLVVKADVQGSVEAVKQSLLKLSNDEVVIKVIHAGVGAINESDVILASASNAIIIGFNVRPDATAKSTAEQEQVDLRLYRVIYDAIEDIEAAMKGMLDPIYEEKVIGHGEVRQTYKASGVGTIAGSYVLDGTIQKNATYRITREGEQIFEGPLTSLKRFKDDVKEVKSGFECGLVFEGFNDIQEFDQFEAYIMVEVPR